MIGSSAALGADGTIYFGSDKSGSNDLVYAVTPGGGLKWTFQVGDNVGISSPTIAADGTIYVGSADGKLHAINGSSGLADSPWPKFRGDLRQSGKARYFAARPWFEFVCVQEDGSFEMIPELLTWC